MYLYLFVLIKLDILKSSSISQFSDFLKNLQEGGFSIMYVKINTRDEIREAVLLLIGEAPSADLITVRSDYCCFCTVVPSSTKTTVLVFERKFDLFSLIFN